MLLLFQQIKMNFIYFRHIRILTFLFVLPAVAASYNSTVSNILDSVNTTQAMSTTTSINSTTDVTGSTGEETQCSSGKESQDSADNIYIDAISATKMFPINFRHIQMLN